MEGATMTHLIRGALGVVLSLGMWEWADYFVFAALILAHQHRLFGFELEFWIPAWLERRHAE